MFRIVPIIICLGLAACAATVTHQTASGKPEVTIMTTEISAVKGLLVSEMLNRGYSITSESGNLVAFDRPVDNAFAAALLGSQYDRTPNARVTYSIAPLGSSTRVIADLAIITNPGSAFERRTDMNSNQDSLMFQDLLDFVAIELELESGE